MRPEDRAAIFGSRTDQRRIDVGPADVATGSRLGGRAPDVLAAIPVRCPRCGGATEYDLTLSAADLGAPFEVSHFHCRDFACLLAGAATVALPRLPSTVALAHAASRRAAMAAAHDSDIEGRALQVGDPRPDRAPGDAPDEHSKLGGQPGFLQPEDALAAELAAAGLGFLFQLSELDYPKGLRVGTYRYAGGSFYVYATFDAQPAPAAGALRSFWQRT